jgi:hypothetical protein
MITLTSQVENQEFDLNFTSDDKSMPASSAVDRWQGLWNEGIESVGMTARCDPKKMAEQMKAAGFINVTVQSFKMPLGRARRTRDFVKLGNSILSGWTVD